MLRLSKEIDAAPELRQRAKKLADRIDVQLGLQDAAKRKQRSVGASPSRK